MGIILLVCKKCEQVFACEIDGKVALCKGCYFEGHCNVGKNIVHEVRGKCSNCT